MELIKNLNINVKGLTKNVQTRIQFLHNVEYIVAPVNMIVEGVLPGSQGAIFYNADQIKLSEPYWDGVPVTINHPTDNNGNSVSARTPSVLEDYGVGQIYNTFFDTTTNTLKAEAWINKSILETKFPEVYNMVTSDTFNMEISTGVFLEEQKISGNFAGNSYNTIGLNFHGDHLALLPNDTGACSWVDGCGLRTNKKGLKMKINKKEKQFIFNESSFDQIIDQIRRHVYSSDSANRDSYLTGVWPSYFIYKTETRMNENQRWESKLWKQSYSNTNDVITIANDAVEVVGEMVYTEVSTGTQTITNKIIGDEMANEKPCCPEKVKSLIGATNNSFTADNEEFLLSLNAKQLESAELLATNKQTEVKETVVEKEKVENATTEKVVFTNMSDFIESAPEDIKIALNALVKADNDKRTTLIDTLVANEDCLFEKDELVAFTTNQLEKLSGFAKKPAVVEAETPAHMVGNAASSQEAVIPGEADTLAEADLLVAPVANWTKK